MSKHKRPPLVDEACLPGAEIPGVCDRCCATLPPRRRRWCSDECSAAYFADHVFAHSRERARKRDNRRCANGCEPTWEGVEVDHIVAARGAHSKHSCVHHLDNLRTLCRPCHVKRTAEQRRVGPDAADIGAMTLKQIGMGVSLFDAARDQAARIARGQS